MADEKRIPLRGKYGVGKYAIVSPKDYENLIKYKWHVHHHGYPERTEKLSNGNIIHIKMHHQIIGKPPKGLVVDHINGNRLDNRRENLRFCTQRDNARNKGLSKSNTSGYKGVSYNKSRNKWSAYILRDDSYHIGYFDTAEEAANAYDYYAKKFYGDFARLNFPDKEPVKPKHREYTTKYRGVYWCKRDKVFRSQIQVNKKRYTLGSFKTAEAAALAYNKKAKELLGEKAVLNIVEAGE